MYFSMQDERQVCSLEDSEVEGLGIQVAKQFLESGRQSRVHQEMRRDKRAPRHLWGSRRLLDDKGFL